MDLHRVRGVPGVEWAVPLYKGQVRARLADGATRSLILLGLDDATLVGAPLEMLAGSLADLRKPDAVVIDKAGYEYFFPDEVERLPREGYRLGRVFQMNDRRAVLVGVCKASAPFVTLPLVYTRYSRAIRYAPGERDVMTFILAKPKAGEDTAEVCRRIDVATGRMALTREGFFWKTIGYFLGSTGIPINFGITIALGFLVGVAVAGQTFYLFVVENLKQFGSLKAMGVRDGRIVRMVLLQGLLIGALGYCFGVGMSAAFFTTTNTMTNLAGLVMEWPAMVGVAAAVGVIVLLASVTSLRRLLTLEPAIVFRG
jgi:putative ABC transport system permease protein